MKNYVLLAIIFLSVLYVAVNSFSQSAGSLQADFVAATENPITPHDDVFVEPAQESGVVKTPNGLTLKSEQITNFRNETKHIIIETSTDDGRTFYFNVSISPNTTLSYANLNGFLIVPQKDAIVTNRTSFYSGSDELAVILDGNTTEVYIYVDKKGPPSLMVTKGDAFWKYDKNTDIVVVTSNDGNISQVIMFWTASFEEVVFIEDTRRKENLAYGLVELDESILQLQSDVETEKANVEILKDDLRKSNEELDKSRLDILEKEKTVDNIRKGIKDGENLITANVVVSPLQTAVGVVIVLILLVLAADTFLFRPRRGS